MQVKAETAIADAARLGGETGDLAGPGQSGSLMPPRLPQWGRKAGRQVGQQNLLTRQSAAELHGCIICVDVLPHSRE